jgi:hypothetical protein
MDVEDVAARVFKAKGIWLDWAEIVDSYRLVPRAILFLLAHTVVSLDTTLVYWYIHLPSGQRTPADATAVCSIVTVFSALMGAAIKFYLDSGRQWAAKPAGDPTVK